MKPKPLASLNHLTVPVSRFDIFLLLGTSYLKYRMCGDVLFARSKRGATMSRIRDLRHRATIHGDPWQAARRTLAPCRRDCNKRMHRAPLPFSRGRRLSLPLPAATDTGPAR